ncbi:endodeoxyribonuclease [Emydomyces testavorans]|uniref:DNA topoisomerase (ATP-hydrolyzing) n=1 Tax=Emydomyces testavorans TaxID=2070801 RepID=A0AAF0IGS1_9EURO|nr:endodeoxyribonuclease [Emydomyces testavorans]
MGRFPSEGRIAGTGYNLKEEKVKQFIDATLGSIIDELSKPNGRPSVTLKRRPARVNCFLNEETRALQANENVEDCEVTYSWPGKTAREAWRFGVVMRILGHISEAIQGQFVASKRDIYYLDPEYFGSQRMVDRYIDDISYTIGVDRMALHVAAAAKGLTAGCFKIRLQNGDILNVGEHAEVREKFSMFFLVILTGKQGILISMVENIAEIDLSDVNWILIIEKEGKGYPDLSTRAFLRSMFERNSSATNQITRFVPMYILVDSDPDGMAIMSTYKYGSVAQVHENANLNVPNIEWVGLRSSDVATGVNTAADRPLIPLTLRDRRKAQTMLSKSPVFSEEQEPGWRLELQRMLLMNVKAEIEVLYEYEGGIERWLDKMLSELI